MSAGTEFNNKQDLIDAVVALIYTNVGNSVSAADVQLSACHMIETLWRDFALDLVQDITHDDLSIAVGAGALIPGVYYRFTYENIHLIHNTGVVNLEVPGYSGTTEVLLVKATSVNTLHGFALSETNKYDVITYDYLSTIIGTSLTPTQGTITHRESLEKQIKAPFDFRNHWVARENADWTSYNQAGNVTADRADFVEQAQGAPGDVFACWFDGTTASGAPSSLTTRLWTSSQFANQFFHNASVLTGPNGSLIAQDGAVVYLLALDVATNSNVQVASTAVNVRLSGCTDITIEGVTNDVDLLNCKRVEIREACSAVILEASWDVVLGRNSSSVGMYASYNLEIGRKCSATWFSDSFDSEFGANLTNSIIRDMVNSKVGYSVTSLMTTILSASSIGPENSFISMGYGKGLVTLSSCSNIASLGGDFNTFEEACNTINMDNRNGAGGRYDYMTYSPLDYTTFEKGCNNIVFGTGGFNPTFVRRCTFGQGCSNLTFDAVTADCTFARGTKNKDFRGKEMQSMTFLNPSSTAWTYDVGVYTGEFLTSGFRVTGSPDPFIVNTNTMQRADATTLPIIDSTFERVFRWNFAGRPIAFLVS